MDEDGYLFINGRVKNLIILSNGENVSPEELENKLALNPLVAEVIVTGEENGLTARIYPEQKADCLSLSFVFSYYSSFKNSNTIPIHNSVSLYRLNRNSLYYQSPYSR